MLESLTDQLLALAGSPWALVLLAALCAFDALLPPLPSETVVIGLATVGAAGHGSSPWLVLVVAGVAAWVGDRLVFELGRLLPAGRAAARWPRVGVAVERAGRLLHERGAPFIVSARYVPTGRAAVNLAAGATRYPSRRFAAFSAVAVTLWAGWSVGLGVGVGAALADQPLVAMVVGVVGGVVVGLAVELVLRWVRARRVPARAASARPPTERRGMPGHSVGGPAVVASVGSQAATGAAGAAGAAAGSRSAAPERSGAAGAAGATSRR